MLTRHFSHQDFMGVLRILSERLVYFERFCFPTSDKQLAHVEFEQFRQFYSGMQNFNSDILVTNTYMNEPILTTQNTTTSQFELQWLGLGREK